MNLLLPKIVELFKADVDLNAKQYKPAIEIADKFSYLFNINNVKQNPFILIDGIGGGEAKSTLANTIEYKLEVGINILFYYSGNNYQLPLVGNANQHGLYDYIDIIHAILNRNKYIKEDGNIITSGKDADYSWQRVDYRNETRGVVVGALITTTYFRYVDYTYKYNH